jgi:hypothetical protein
MPGFRLRAQDFQLIGVTFLKNPFLVPMKHLSHSMKLNGRQFIQWIIIHMMVGNGVITLNIMKSENRDCKQENKEN